MDQVTKLWRPTGPTELALVEESGWRQWPPRLPDQPIFYPVLNVDYAIKIARDWNVPRGGIGYVTEFEVETEFLQRYPVRQAGGRDIVELWVPADELPEFNDHIVGLIRVTHTFSDSKLGHTGTSVPTPRSTWTSTAEPQPLVVPTSPPSGEVVVSIGHDCRDVTVGGQQPCRTARTGSPIWAA